MSRARSLASVAQYTPVNKAGDTITGDLKVSGFIGAGTVANPIRQVHTGTTGSNEWIIEQIGAKANGSKWNHVVWNGSGTKNADYLLRILNDAGTAGTITGYAIDGTTGKFSTTPRMIDPASVPSGSVIKVQHNVIAGGYTGTHFSPQQIDLFNQSFTPLYASSKVLVMISTGVNMICDGRVALTRGGQIIKDSWFGSSRQDNQHDWPQAAQFYLDSPNTTSSVTYGIAAWAPGCGGLVQIGGSDNHSSWTFLEIAA